MTDSDGRVGEERRAIAVHHDPTLTPGFPVKIGHGGESQPVLAGATSSHRTARRWGLRACPDATLGLLSGLANGTLDATAITGILAGDCPTTRPSTHRNGRIGKVGATSTLAVAEPGSGVASVATSLLLPGLGTPINNYMRVHDAASGAPLPGSPRRPRGSTPRGTGDRRRHRDGQPDVTRAATARRSTRTTGGAQASGPEAPAADVRPTVGDSRATAKRHVATTREGYRCPGGRTAGRAPTRSGGAHTTMSATPANTASTPARPGPRDASVSAAVAAPDAPGDDWYDGTPDHYDIATSPDAITPESFDSATPPAVRPPPPPRERLSHCGPGRRGAPHRDPGGRRSGQPRAGARLRPPSRDCARRWRWRQRRGSRERRSEGPDRPARQLHEEEASQAAPQAPPKASAQEVQEAQAPPQAQAALAPSAL